MKMNLEIEIDFVNDDYSLEDSFRDEVKRSVVTRVESEVIKQVQPIIDKSINDSIKNTIDGLLNNYLSNPVVVSNGYKTENYDSVLAMIEQKFTSLYDEKFRNKQGCTKDPILEKIAKEITTRVNMLIDEMSTKIKREGDRIANEAIKNSGLSKAIENIQGKK